MTGLAAANWEQEFAKGERFAFGENWSAFLQHLDDHRIRRAEASLQAMLGLERLDGLRFLDIGSGSGLFSLAARRLGASVTSFDYDPQSVACTAELRRRFDHEDEHWRILQGSVLDKTLLARLTRFDIVYSWGALHHTGAMWDAIGNAASLVAPGGLLNIAIYNDQGRKSRTWRRIKKAYVGARGPMKWAVLAPAFVRLWGPTMLRDALHGRPFHTWRNYATEGTARGMHPWRDVVDWVGGYPFEVAKPEEIFEFCRERGFELLKLRTCGGGLACNEFLFRRAAPQL